MVREHLRVIPHLHLTHPIRRMGVTISPTFVTREGYSIDALYLSVDSFRLLNLGGKNYQCVFTVKAYVSRTAKLAGASSVSLPQNLEQIECVLSTVDFSRLTIYGQAYVALMRTWHNAGYTLTTVLESGEPLSNQFIYDYNGYNVDGFNHLGFNSSGYDKNGFNADGYNSGGFNAQGYNAAGYNAQGYNSAGFNVSGYNMLGYNSDGYNSDGYNAQGYNADGYNAQGVNIQGYMANGQPGPALSTMEGMSTVSGLMMISHLSSMYGLSTIEGISTIESLSSIAGISTIEGLSTIESMSTMEGQSTMQG